MSKLFSIRCPRRVSSIISLFLLISLSLCVSSQNVQKKICQTEECLASAKNFKESMNFDVDPCDDFYKYACGNWSQNSDKLRSSTFISRRYDTFLEILDFLKQNNSNDEPEAVHKARKFFSVCKSEGSYRNDLKQIETTLQNIGIPVDSLYSNRIVKYDYSLAIAKAAKLTETNLYFQIEIITNPHNQTADTISLTVAKSSSPNSTIDEQDKFEVIQRMCGNNTSPSCKKLLVLLNFTKNSNTEETAKPTSEISKIDTESDSILNSSHPVQYNLKQLQTLTDDISVEVNATIPTFNWTSYVEELFIDENNVTLDSNDLNKLQITIEELDSVKEMIQYIHKKENTKIIAYELLREVIYTLQPYVDSTGKTDEYCYNETVKLFSWPISYMYATTEKYIKAKTEVPALLEHLRETFQQLIQQTTWMGETTKQRALKKIQLLHPFVAYPSSFTNTSTNTSILDVLYKDVLITDNFYDSKSSSNIIRLLRNIRDPRFQKWALSPHNVNAAYSPKINSIYIPAGILGHPFYGNGLDALDYGAIGFAVGHEMAHSIDNNGRDYNETGGIEDWWQSKTAQLYHQKANCFVKAKLNYTGASNVSISKKQDPEISANLGEDLSDNVGFKESVLAYRKCVSLTGEEPLLPQFENFNHEQLLTLAFANIWCKIPSTSSTQTDEHSAAEFRVNGVLQNSEEFSKIWKCPKGSKMNPSGEKCTLW